MYCQTCGNSVNEKLKYCNSCGERLGRDAEENDTGPGKMLDDILETLFWFAILGLGIMVGLVAVMLNRDVKTEVVTVIVIAYLSVIFGVCFMLARQVPKLIDAKLKVWDRSAETQQPQLSPRTTAQLEEPRQPIASVTDHTTKTLDPVPLKTRN